MTSMFVISPKPALLRHIQNQTKCFLPKTPCICLLLIRAHVDERTHSLKGMTASFPIVQKSILSTSHVCFLSFFRFSYTYNICFFAIFLLQRVATPTPFYHSITFYRDWESPSRTPILCPALDCSALTAEYSLPKAVKYLSQIV